METVWVVGVKGEGREWKNKWFHCVTKPTVQPHLDYRLLSSSDLSNGKIELKRTQREDTRVKKTWKTAREWLINNSFWSQGLFSHKKRQQGQEYDKSFKSQKAQKAWQEKRLFFLIWELKAIKLKYHLKRYKMQGTKVQNTKGTTASIKIVEFISSKQFACQIFLLLQNATILIHTQHKTLKDKLEAT